MCASRRCRKKGILVLPARHPFRIHPLFQRRQIPTPPPPPIIPNPTSNIQNSKPPPSPPGLEYRLAGFKAGQDFELPRDPRGFGGGDEQRSCSNILYLEFDQWNGVVKRW